MEFDRIAVDDADKDRNTIRRNFIRELYEKDKIAHRNRESNIFTIEEIWNKSLRAFDLSYVKEKIIELSMEDDPEIELIDMESGKIRLTNKGRKNYEILLENLDIKDRNIIDDNLKDSKIRSETESTSKEEQSIEKEEKKSIDKPSHYVPTLKDLPSLEDKLGRKSLAKVISNTIDRIKSQSQVTTKQIEGPFIINIHGPWGSGKTTLSNFIGEELIQKEPSWVIVKFNAWEYQRLNTPPWWILMDLIYRQGYKSLKGKHKIILKISEFFWRLWIRKSNFLIGLILFFIFIIISVFFFSQADLSLSEPDGNNKILDFIKGMAGLVGIVGSLITGIILIKNSMIPGSIGNVREFINKTNDPTTQFNQHFQKLIKKINLPVIVFIDDLDRCKENYVVEFLEGIHTVFKNANVFYVITADQRWIYTSYEKTYENFSKLNDEIGRPLGYLFMDKIFQLMIPLPKLTPLDQKNYLDYILSNRSEDRPEKNEMNYTLETSEDPNEIIDIINKGQTNTIQDRILRERAILRLDEKDIQKKTEHFLNAFVNYLEPNPRSMIRFVNIFNIVRAVNILSAKKIDNQKLALWIIVALRWPILARYLQNNSEKITYIGKRTMDNDRDIPKEIKTLFRNPEIDTILNKNTLGISVDENTIKEIILWSI